VSVSGCLVVYTDIISKPSGDYIYLLLRERKPKNVRTYNFFPAIKALKYNKYLVKRLLRLEIGDVVHTKGELGFITNKLPMPHLKPPYISQKKMVIFIKNIEWERHIDIKDTDIDMFLDITDDDYLKALSIEEIEQIEEMLETKLKE
jgi:hypothetical protein